MLGGCETHVTRKIDEHKRLLQDEEYYKSVVQPLFRDLVCSANENIFFIIAGFAIQSWETTVSFQPFVAWLLKVYLNYEWFRFANYITPPGCDTTNQIIEACNKGNSRTIDQLFH